MTSDLLPLQDRKLQELFHGRFSLQEARELIAAKGGLEKAALFVLNGKHKILKCLCVYVCMRMRSNACVRARVILRLYLQVSLYTWVCGSVTWVLNIDRLKFFFKVVLIKQMLEFFLSCCSSSYYINIIAHYSVKAIQMKSQPSFFIGEM